MIGDALLSRVHILRIPAGGTPHSSVPNIQLFGIIAQLEANAFADDVKQSLQAGFTEHLSKPLDSATLVSALQRARADAACRKPTPPAEGGLP